MIYSLQSFRVLSVVRAAIELRWKNAHLMTLHPPIIPGYLRIIIIIIIILYIYAITNSKRRKMWRGNNVQRWPRRRRDNDPRPYGPKRRTRARGGDDVCVYTHSCREGAQRAFVCSIIVLSCIITANVQQSPVLNRSCARGASAFIIIYVRIIFTRLSEHRWMPQKRFACERRAPNSHNARRR